MDYSRRPVGNHAGLRSNFYRTPQEEQQAIRNNQERQVADLNSFSRGLRRGGHQTAGMLLDAAVEGRANFQHDGVDSTGDPDSEAPAERSQPRCPMQ